MIFLSKIVCKVLVYMYVGSLYLFIVVGIQNKVRKMEERERETHKLRGLAIPLYLHVKV